jgi:uncharacterized membrane protein
MTVRKKVRTWIRDSLVAGLIAVAPLAVVWIVVDKLVFETNGVLGWLPVEWQEAAWTPPWANLSIPVLKTPGLGFLLTLVLIVLVGWIARGLFGRRVVAKITDGFTQIPILGTIYSAVRQLLEAVFSSQAQQFQRVVMVQFPREGAYVLGFITAKAWSGVSEALGKPMVSVFVPTTPNPTSGFFVMFPETDVIALNMTVEEAFKAIMSSGIVQPADGGEMTMNVGTMTLNIEPVKP